MKLPGMNVEYAPGDRKPKRSMAQAQQAAAVADLVRAARANGDSLTGPTGLLRQVTAIVLEAGLDEELTEHLGHAKHQGNLIPEDEGVDDDAHASMTTASDRCKLVMFAMVPGLRRY